MTTMTAPVHCPVVLSPSITQIAEETFVIRRREARDGLALDVNSLLIRGAEPVIVDTSNAAGRDEWFAALATLVEATAVRWIFVSHDGPDHAGNLPEALEVFSNARVVASPEVVQRLAARLGLPEERLMAIEDGESFSAGDRRLVAVRPPVYDGADTLGLYDSESRVYWAGDAFGAAIGQATDGIDNLCTEEWRQGFQAYHLALAPWLKLVDAGAFDEDVRRLTRLGIEVLAGAHTPPVCRRSYVASAIDMLYDLPAARPELLPDLDSVAHLLRELRAV